MIATGIQRTQKKNDPQRSYRHHERPAKSENPIGIGGGERNCKKSEKTDTVSPEPPPLEKTSVYGITSRVTLDLGQGLGRAKKAGRKKKKNLRWRGKKSQLGGRWN